MPEIPPKGPALPWRTRIFASAITTLTSVSIRRDGTVNRLLLSLFGLKSSPNANPINGVKSSDYTVDPARDLWIRLFSSSDGGVSSNSPLPVIVYFHGGGFAFHSAASGPYDAFCRRVARGVPATVVSVDYRLSPEHRCPAPYDDGFDVLQWIDDREDLFPDVSKVFLAGDSAGGNIAHHVASRSSAAASFERVRITGAVLLQPFFGGEERTGSEVRLDGMPMGSLDRSDWMWKVFLPVGSDRDHEAANPFSSERRPGLTGFPPTLVCVGGFDPLRDRQMRYFEWLKGAGVDVCLAEYQNAIHGFYVFAELPDAGKVITEIKDFVMRPMQA